MSSTSNERSTNPPPPSNNDDVYDPQVAAVAVNYLASTANSTDDYNHQSHHPYAYSAELQHRAELQRRQQQLQQQELQHQQQQLQQYQHQQRELQQAQVRAQQQAQIQFQSPLAHIQQQQLPPLPPSSSSSQRVNPHQQQQQQQQQQQAHHLQSSQPLVQPQSQSLSHGSPSDDQSDDEFETGEDLRSRFIENEIIKTFDDKKSLVNYVKHELGPEENCKIVINSSKPKAVYFQCERSGSFRTTVKDPQKRQRIAYTKRNKCAFRLVANLYPNDKESKKTKLDDEPDNSEMWILRMINPQHNHPPDPMNRKKKQKSARTLVQKPINKSIKAEVPDIQAFDQHQAAAQQAAVQAQQAQLSNQMPTTPNYSDILTLHNIPQPTNHNLQHQHHNLHHRSIQQHHQNPLDQPDVIAAIEASTHHQQPHHQFAQPPHTQNDVNAVAAAAAMNSQNASTIDSNIDPGFS